MKFRVTNWPEYEAGLGHRGSLTLWVTPEALSRWQAPRRKTRGGQHRYSDLAIHYRATFAGTVASRSADRSRRRLRRPQPHACLRTPEIRPPQGSHGIVCRFKIAIRLSPDPCTNASGILIEGAIMKSA